MGGTGLRAGNNELFPVFVRKVYILRFNFHAEELGFILDFDPNSADFIFGSMRESAWAINFNLSC